MKVRYFGKWSAESRDGHGMHMPSGDSDYDAERDVKRMVGAGPDGNRNLLPGTFSVYGPHVRNPPNDEQVQGVFRHTVWTDGPERVSCLATWDRSADRRYASNSSFWVWGTANASEAERLARAAFPWQWARLDDAGSPESRRRSDATVLANAGLSPCVAGALTDASLREVADLIRRMKETP